MLKTILLEMKNDFHNTSIWIRIPQKCRSHRLTPTQIKQVDSLCGVKDCVCYATRPALTEWVMDNQGWDNMGRILVVREDENE